MCPNVKVYFYTVNHFKNTECTAIKLDWSKTFGVSFLLKWLNVDWKNITFKIFVVFSINKVYFSPVFPLI